MQLGYELRGTHDGTGHQLREEAQVKAKVQEILHRLNPAALHIHDIAHGLEGKERDTHRQDDGVYAENLHPGKDVEPFSQDIVNLILPLADTAIWPL